LNWSATTAIVVSIIFKNEKPAMEWDDLKYLLAVARTGSLSDAAKDLKTSPATVSRRIALLERRLQSRLFDRKPTGYSLTERGERVRLRAEQIETAVLAVERESFGGDLHPTGKVSVASTEDMAAGLIVPNLPAFRSRAPGIAIELNCQVDLTNLARREADISLRQVRPQEGNLVIRRVGSWPLGLYAARSFVEARELDRGDLDLSRLEMITWTDESAHLQGGPWLARHAPNAPVALKVNSRRVRQAACKAGLGAAILPCLFGDADPDLVCVLPPERVIVLDIWLVVHRDLARASRIRTVIEFLSTAAGGTGWPSRTK
jgi:DNA-binding transcriptional LysR family regulator